MSAPGMPDRSREQAGDRAESRVRGWCPGALRPMRSGDGLLVRIRPPAGRLSQEQANGVALLAGRHGNGLIDLSTRANMQIRGVSEASHAPLVAGLAVLGLVDPTPEAEARRNVIVTPYRKAGDGTDDLADRLCRALLDDLALILPGKFGFAVDTGPRPVLREVSADIRIERDGAGALLCRADGSIRGARVIRETMADTALDLARWFVGSGGRSRMAAHLLEGAVPPAVFTAHAVAPEPESPSPPVPGPTTAGFMVGLAFGQMRTHTLAALAALAPLRVTPWRMLLLEDRIDAPGIEGLIASADDPLLRVVACPGAPDCAQGLQPTRTLARALAPYVPRGALLHVSGCAKGCAHPAPAPFTLTARAQGFGLVRNGDAAVSLPDRLLTADRLLAAPRLLTPVWLTEESDAPSV